MAVRGHALKLAARATMNSNLQPLFFGRLTRIIAGAVLIYFAVHFWGDSALQLILALALVFLGVSLTVGGIVANPGCEVTALPNLVLPPEKRLHSF
jgi:hypothetical protein